MIYTKQEITDYIQQHFAFSNSQKVVLTSSLNQNGNEFYVHAMNYLISSHEQYSKEDIIKITSYGFIYYVSLLKVDNEIDKKESSNNTILEVVQFVENAIKGLGSVFGSNSDFWNKFNECKQLYYKGIKLENELKNTEIICDQTYFENLAECKSAFCYAYLYALNTLNSVENLDEKFEILRLIHVSMQYCDDIDDFIIDIHDGQTTYIFTEIRSFLNNQTKVNPNSLEPEQLLRYVHVSGLSIKHFNRAIELLEQAKVLAQRNNLIELISYIDNRIACLEVRVFEIDALNQKSISKSKQESGIKNFRLNDENIRVYAELALNDGLKYLKNWYNKSTNSWEDFLTSAGLGKTWITGYVLNNIHGIREIEELYDQASESFISSYNGLAGFHENLIPDADSSNFYFLVKALENSVPNESHIQEWLKFMNIDGGWSTYLDHSGLIKILNYPSDTKLDGWMNPQNCVSAVSASVLAKYPHLQIEYYNTCNFLKSKISENGAIESYWWTSDVYATAYTLIAFSHSSIYNSECEQLQNWLLQQVNENGFVLDTKTGEKSVFYTSLVAKALMQYDFSQNFHTINSCLNWILKNQVLDGSWQSTTILQIPDPRVDNVSLIKSWKKTPFGVNCLVEDHNRIFTTSLVVNVICNFISNNVKSKKVC